MKRSSLAAGLMCVSRRTTRPDAASTEMSERAAKKAESRSSCAMLRSSGRLAARALSLAARMVATCLAIAAGSCASMYWCGSAR